MKDRGKAVEVYNNDFCQDYSTSSDLPCRKHPQVSSVGICPYCLKDRLVKLVCSDCGEQRLSSCSCSEISSNPRTSCTGEWRRIGRGFFLKRSNSSCVEIKRKNGFWKIGRLFRRKKDHRDSGKSAGGMDEKSDLWVVDYAGGVSRSRSLCSFRGGGFFGSEDGGDLMNYSGARSSISAARSSSVNGGLVFDPERKSGFSEAEPRKSGFDSDRRDSTDVGPDVKSGFTGANRRVFSLKESYFSGGDDSGMRVADFVPPETGDSTLAGDGGIYNGGSCRITLNDRGIKKSRKSFKGWRWIFKNHQTWASNPRKKDEDLTVNP
ncbi:hypothetical protein SLE2022_219600 [Rubroshorea leprosula]